MPCVPFGSDTTEFPRMDQRHSFYPDFPRPILRQELDDQEMAPLNSIWTRNHGKVCDICPIEQKVSELNSPSVEPALTSIASCVRLPQVLR